MAINWSPGIGDPTPLGWLTVAAYFIASALSLRAAFASKFPDSERRSEGFFWIFLAIASFALCINKQLDLQSLLTEVALVMAKEGGWYNQRRSVQEVSILLVAIIGGAGILSFTVLLRKANSAVRIAAIGFCFVLSFVVIRATSFHRVDLLIGEEVLGVRWNALLELPGILMISWGAYTYVAAGRKARHQSFRSSDVDV